LTAELENLTHVAIICGKLHWNAWCIH